MKSVLVAAAIVIASGAAVAQQRTQEGLPDQIEFINRTAEPIEEVRISRQVEEVWGGDRLRGRVIMPGETVRLPVQDLQGDCFFDVRVGGRSGSDTAYFGLNLCRSPVVAAE